MVLRGIFPSTSYPLVENIHRRKRKAECSIDLKNNVSSSRTVQTTLLTHPPHDLSSSPPQKRVRFADRKINQIQGYAESDTTIEELKKKKLWWTKAEFNDRCEESQELIREFRSDHIDQVRAINYIVSQSSQTTKEASDYLETAKINLPTYIRGLEASIAPILKTNRKEHVHKVLDAQERIRGRLSAEMRIRVLGNESLRSSRSGKIVSRMIGDGDATVDEPTRAHRRPRCNMISSL